MEFGCQGLVHYGIRAVVGVSSIGAVLLGVTPTQAQEGDQFVRPNNPGPERFAKRVVTDGLESPYEIIYGPDGYLWLTERTGKRVVRVHPRTGARSVAITIDEVHQSAGQDGLLGMALHPSLLRGPRSNFVYVAYTYDADPGEALDRRAKLRRYTYNPFTQRLHSPLDLIVGLQASHDHNSGRLQFGPDQKLYYTIGDQGKNQGLNFCLEIQAQRLPTQAEVDQEDWWAYQGKILRLNLDGSIPRDNPVLDGVRSHIFSYGHRNAQGIGFGSLGTLYSVEHGPKSDDELNAIRSGGNYGWPYIAGYQDEQAYQYDRWFEASPTPCEELTFSNYVVPPDVPNTQEGDVCLDNFESPIKTFYTVPDDHDFLTGPGCDGTSSCSPTIAPSAVEFYDSRGIPGWRNSLLITTLKEGKVFRVKLLAPGVTAPGDALTYFDAENRYRDLALSPDGKSIFLITDSQGVTIGPTGAYNTVLENPGAVLEFRYAGRR